jgi:hypothetical protein
MPWRTQWEEDSYWKHRQNYEEQKAEEDDRKAIKLHKKLLLEITKDERYRLALLQEQPNAS